ncbi:hypothetical protein V2J09_021248 [Rumex salicifolius]
MINTEKPTKPIIPSGESNSNTMKQRCRSHKRKNVLGMPPHILNLKEGLSVMLLHNVNPSQGLCNGTRLLVTRLGEWIIEAEIIIGSNVGNFVENFVFDGETEMDIDNTE